MDSDQVRDGYRGASLAPDHSAGPSEAAPAKYVTPFRYIYQHASLVARHANEREQPRNAPDHLPSPSPRGTENGSEMIQEGKGNDAGGVVSIEDGGPGPPDRGPAAHAGGAGEMLHHPELPSIPLETVASEVDSMFGKLLVTETKCRELTQKQPLAGQSLYDVTEFLEAMPHSTLTKLQRGKMNPEATVRYWLSRALMPRQVHGETLTPSWIQCRNGFLDAMMFSSELQQWPEPPKVVLSAEERNETMPGMYSGYLLTLGYELVHLLNRDLVRVDAQNLGPQQQPQEELEEFRPLNDRYRYKRVGEDYYLLTRFGWVKSLDSGSYLALTNLHRTLLYEHHDFLLGSSHPMASQLLRNYPRRYAMAERMWVYGVQACLNFLYCRLPEAWHHIMSFIHTSYNMLSCLEETVPIYKDIWQECKGDLARYR